VVRFQKGGQKILLFPKLSRPDQGPKQLPIQWESGAFSPGVKQPKRESDHLHLSSVEFNNDWSYISTPAHAFMAYTGITLP
jgi:hypothetical protein